MGCVFISHNDITQKNEISLTPLPNTSIRKIRTDSYGVGMEDTNKSKIVNNNNIERNNNLSSLNFGHITCDLQMKNSQEMELSPFYINKITKISSHIRGFLFRKKYDEYLKTQLMDYTNEIYFEFIILTKNYKSSKVLNDKKNKKIKEIFKISWNDFYEKDPTVLIREKLNKIKKYTNGLIFTYKNKNFNQSDINECLKNAESCYKGSVDIFTNKKNGYGELINIDGRQQIGTFYNDEFCGWNLDVNKNGFIYKGLFSHGVLDGKGIYYNPEIDYEYKGDFKNMKREGNGTELFDGNEYIGEFRDDKKNGQGIMKIKNNDLYRGNFTNDKYNGMGCYIWSNKKKEYNGNFVDGKMHGNGTLKWGENKYYKGNFNNGIKEGKAEFGFINGYIFFFNFKDDIPCGKGYKQDTNNSLSEVYYNQGKIIDKNMKEIIFSFQ